MAMELREEEERPNPAGEITQQGPLAKGGGKKTHIPPQECRDSLLLLWGFG